MFTEWRELISNSFGVEVLQVYQYEFGFMGKHTKGSWDPSNGDISILNSLSEVESTRIMFHELAHHVGMQSMTVYEISDYYFWDRRFEETVADLTANKLIQFYNLNTRELQKEHEQYLTSYSIEDYDLAEEIAEQRFKLITEKLFKNLNKKAA